MNFFKKIGKAIASVFKSLFNAAEKAYNKLSPEQQAAIQNGSGLVALINSMTESTPVEIRAAIQKQFPNLDEKKLEDAIFHLAQAFGLTSASNIDEEIEAIKKYLSELQGKAWATASHIGASVLAVFFAPADTKVGVLFSLIEWAYHKFFKK